MNTTTTTQNTPAKLCEDLSENEKEFFDIYMKLPAHEQAKAKAAIVAAVKICNATPEQITALCGRLGITDNPSRYICSLSARNETAAFWAACEAVDDITEHKTIDELRAISAARKGA